LSIQPEEQISLRLSVKYPGVHNIPFVKHMEFSYEKSFNVKTHPPYERLLIDCMRGDLTLFARQDGIESMWGVVDPIIKRWEENPAKNFPNYSAGTRGPEEADEIMRSDSRRWRS
jgi:glucose-6-phosphate 1-dehydrogenase